MSVVDKLKVFGLSIRESDSPDREAIDFTIEDKEDNVAWVWGTSPDDVEWECWHPIVEFSSDPEELGECLLCGSHCAWHYEEDDEGNKVREPHEWFALKHIRVGGMLGGILKEIVERKHF